MTRARSPVIPKITSTSAGDRSFAPAVRLPSSRAEHFSFEPKGEYGLVRPRRSR